MAQPFYPRLRIYYNKVAEAMRGESDAASIFPNGSDIGSSREQLYVDFLKLHAPAKCNVFKGGFLFDFHGAESKQIDVIVTTDITPRFDLLNRDGSGKAFSPVEGTLAVVSLKSNLNGPELRDALENLASIPPTMPLAGRMNPALSHYDYQDWPLKVIYAPKGNAPETILSQMREFYLSRPDIPVTRQVNLVHVAGSCAITRGRGDSQVRNHLTGEEWPLPIGEFQGIVHEPDIEAMAQVLHYLHQYAFASSHIDFKYHEIFNCLRRY